MSKIKLHLAAILLAFGMLPASAMAATATGTLNVAATIINPAASISVAGPLDYGTVVANVTSAVASTTFDVTVSSGISYSVQIDRGLTQFLGARYISNSAGTAHLYYVLYQSAPANGVEWGIDVPVSSTGTGAAQTYNVFASGINSSMAGNYSDTLTITVTY